MKLRTVFFVSYAFKGEDESMGFGYCTFTMEYEDTEEEYVNMVEYFREDIEYNDVNKKGDVVILSINKLKEEEIAYDDRRMFKTIKKS